MAALRPPAVPWRALIALGGLGLAGIFGLAVAVMPARGFGAAMALAYLPLVLLNLPAGLAVWIALVFLDKLPQLGLAGTLAGTLVIAAWLGTMGSRRETVRATLERHRWLLTTLLLFVTWLGLSLAWADQPDIGTPELVEYAIALVVFVVVATTPRTPRHLLLLTSAFVIGAAIIVLVGFAQGGLRPAPSALAAEDGFGGRLATGGTDPNYLAAGLVPAIALAAGLAGVTRDPMKRLGLALVIAAAGLGLATTQSRGGLLAAGVAIAVGFVVAPGRRRQVLAVAAVLVTCIAAWLAVDPSFLARLTDDDRGGTGRTELWSVALKMAGDHPVNGVGLLQFPVNSADYARDSGSLEFSSFLTEQPKVTHNAYLQMLAETGVIGLALFLAVIAGALRASWLAAKRLTAAGERALGDLARAVLVAQVAMLTASIFLSNGSDRRIWILLALGPAFLAVAHQLGAPDVRGRARRRLPRPVRLRQRRPSPAPAFGGALGVAGAAGAAGSPFAPGAHAHAPAFAFAASDEQPAPGGGGPRPARPSFATAPRPRTIKDRGFARTLRQLPRPTLQIPTGSTLEAGILRTPALIVIALGVVLGAMHGGFRQTTWYPASLLVLAMLVVVLVLAAPKRRELDRPFLVAVGAMAALTAWTYLSIVWAETPADAWDAANRTLLYLCVVVLVGLRRWPYRLGAIALGLVVVGITGIGLVTLLSATGAEGADQFLGGRLSEPIGYANGNAALWMIAFWPALHLAITRNLPSLVRGLALGSSVLLLGLALLTQSRGGALGFVVTAVAFLLLHPRRWPALAALATSCGLLAVAWSDLIEVRLADSPADLIARAGSARDSLLAAAVLAAALGAAVAFAARRAYGDGGVPARARALADRAFLVGAAVVAVALVGTAFASRGWIDTRWNEFSSASYAGVEDDQTRFTGSLGSGRYDYYRVALNAFAREPLHGIGADSFGVEYLRERRLIEAPRYAHSWLFGVLSQLGIVGAAALAAFLAALAAGIARVRRRGDPLPQGLAIAGLCGGLAWLTHGTVDWLWEFPALSILGLSLFVLAARTRAGSQPVALEDAWEGGGPSLAIVRIGLAVTTVAAVIALALPAAAIRTERRAYDVQAASTDKALERLERAAELNPLNADPLLARSVLARRTGRPAIARQALAEAVSREPQNWLLHFETALLSGSAGRFGEARRAVARAKTLNPRQPVVDDVQRMLRAGKRPDPDDAERALTGQLERHISATDSG